jgi:hypothetical protein
LLNVVPQGEVVAANPSAKAKAWVIFDRIVDRAAGNVKQSNPWFKSPDGQLRFEPDYNTLELLLGVPLYLKAGTQSGVPALALDVWMSYELRRAGFGRDQVWPRPTHPRILPGPVAALLKWLPKGNQKDLLDRITKKAAIAGVTSSSAKILGKNYVKQVDVIITDWHTGPELLISTKRMDSSYAKNAPNRIEESYGDAKNLRLRHPLAALGFALGLRSDVLKKKNLATAEWLFDLLAKLGQEDDAYHATCVILMEYGDEVAIANGEEESPANGIPQPGLEQEDEEDVPEAAPAAEVDRVIAQLPKVTIRKDKTPENLDPGRFLAMMVERVLSTTPINMHVAARDRRKAPRKGLMPGHS